MRLKARVTFFFIILGIGFAYSQTKKKEINVF